MNTAEVLVAGLESEGVEYVFGLPGEENEATMFALRDSELTFVPVRHEQGAAFMADVWGRLTGDAGVCLSTLGPGATNLLTGVADANLDKAPLVAITGQGGLESLHKESHQTLDVVDMFEPVTKWNAQISDPGIVHESVRKAFKTAEYEKPGATHLELPEDVAYEDCEVRPMEERSRVRRPEPDVPSLDRVRDLLADADRPIVIAGNGAVRTDASDELREFVRAYDLPVAATYMGKGAVPDDDEHSLLTLDSGEHEEASDAIDSADLVITVGYDIAEHDPADWNPTGETTVVHVDSEPAEVYEHYDPDVEVVSDIAAAVRELDATCDEIGAAFETDWYDDLREHILADVTPDPDEGDPFTVKRVLPALRDAMDADDVLLSDVGSHKMAIAQNFVTYEPNTCIISNGLASMGISVPGGLAADLAVDANVVAATGDGGFMMNAAELETATRLGCGYTVLLFRDDEYGLITEEQVEHRGEHFGTELGNPDFQTFAESFGIEAYRPADWRELDDALAAAIPSNEMSLVEVVVE
ncbi:MULTISPECIES: acetolactate synthase large subunit [Halorussus]|uniref:acetolactate synthase large subunit n=1 Tax=Halorussus TaxID=1070314 RepID=UPI000E2188FD|nr:MULTISPECIES: acetolactate synthase large subunit [Halorussus]NHN61493.1 acetolactate synthase large subunit [Halorussus sp. JP-T4]